MAGKAQNTAQKDQSMPEVQKPGEAAVDEKVFEEAAHYLDVPLRITILLGSREMKIREILRLKLNSIVDLPKSAGENLDVYINGKLVAFGEVIDMEGNARVRLSDLYVPA